MMQRAYQIAVVVFSVLLIVALSGCVTNTRTKKVTDADIIAESHQAAYKLIQQSGSALAKDEPLLVASFANIDNLESSSSFGRIVSQHFASVFSKQDFKVVEMLLRNNVYISRGEGEFLLTRAIKNISAEHNAQAVIVGTYAVGAARVYVTSKVVRTKDSTVLAAYDFSLPLGPDTKSLLRKK